MTEPLFLMQRYWGSDDSDDESTNESPEDEIDVSQNKNQKEPETINSLTDSKFSSDENKCATNELHINSALDESFHIKKKSPRKRKYEEESENNVTSLVNGNAVETSEHLASGSKAKKRKKSKLNNNTEIHLANKDEDGFQDIKDEQNSLINEEVLEKEGNDNFFPVMKDMIVKDHEKVQRILPDWLSKPTIIPMSIYNEEKAIVDLDFLDNNTKKNLSANDVNHLFPVQLAVIPWLLGCNSNRLIVRPSDLCVSAPTGSGKTLAFVIPIVQSLKTRVVNAIRALIVLPVGDLAIQVFKVFQSFCKGTDLQVALAIGQKSFSQEQLSLVRKSSRGYFSNVDIVVSTPGRLIDHINHTLGFSLKKLQYLIVDEADRMMDEIQHGWLKKVEAATCKNKNENLKCCFPENFTFQRPFPNVTTACVFGCAFEPPLQKLLFSATLSQNPEKLHELSLYRPKLFTTAENSSLSALKNASSQKEAIEKYITPEGLTEYYALCKTTIKPLVVCHILKKFEFKKVLCFTQSLEHSHRLYVVLNNMLESTVRELSSSLKSVQRKIILDQFQNGRVSVLVCSDLVARGIDIKNVDCVISYDMPFHIKTYVHRVGRTARAGKSGVAITLLDNNDFPKLKKMLIIAGKEMPRLFRIDNSDLTPYEDSFKKALHHSSKLINIEKQNGKTFKRPALMRLKKIKSVKNFRTTK